MFFGLLGCSLWCRRDLIWFQTPFDPTPLRLSSTCCKCLGQRHRHGSAEIGPLELSLPWVRSSPMAPSGNAAHWALGRPGLHRMHLAGPTPWGWSLRPWKTFGLFKNVKWKEIQVLKHPKTCTVWHCFQWTEWRIRCDAKCLNYSDVVAFLLSYALLLLFEQTVLNHANFREAALGAMSGMCTSFYVTSIQYQGRTKTANGKIWQNNLNLPNVRNPFTPVFMEPCIGMAFLWEMMLFWKTRGKMVQGVISCIHGPSSLESVLQVVPPIIPPIARPERSSLTTRTMDSCSWSFTTNRLSLPDHAKRPTMVVYWCFLSLEWPPQPPEPILGFKNCEHIAHKLQLAITEVGEVVQCLEHPGFWWCPCWWNLVNPHKSCTYESTSATIQNPHGIVPCSIPRCHSWQTRPPSDWTNSGCVQLGWQLQSACST